MLDGSALGVVEIVNERRSHPGIVGNGPDRPRMPSMSPRGRQATIAPSPMASGAIVSGPRQREDVADAFMDDPAVLDAFLGATLTFR